jgi:hypothetical protein
MRNPGHFRRFLFLLLLLLLTVTAGCASENTVSFKAEIDEVSDTGILVKTVDFEDFDKASVMLGSKYDFEPAVASWLR